MQLNSNQKLDMERLFVKTKQLIMMVLPCTTGDNLIGCLKSKTLPYHEEHYWTLVEKKEKADQTAQVNASMINHTNLFKVCICHKGGATGYAGYAKAYPDFSKLSHKNAIKSKF